MWGLFQEHFARDPGGIWKLNKYAYHEDVQKYKDGRYLYDDNVIISANVRKVH